MNCDGCHGGGGAGWVGPSLADGRWRFGGADGAIFQSIYYGRPHGMPAYGGLLLAPPAVWKLVTHIPSLQPPADPPTEAWRRGRATPRPSSPAPWRPSPATPGSPLRTPP